MGEVEGFSRSRTFWEVMRQFGACAPKHGLEQIEEMFGDSMSDQQRARFVSTLHENLELLDGVALVDSDGISYLGDARVAAAIRVLALGRDFARRARAASTAVVVDTDGSELDFLELAENALEEVASATSIYQRGPRTIEAELVGDVDRARALAPLAMAGADIACDAILNSADLRSWLEPPHPDFLECNLWAWSDDRDQRTVVSRRGSGIDIRITFDPLWVGEDDSLERGVDLVWEALEQAAKRFGFPLPPRPQT